MLVPYSSDPHLKLVQWPPFLLASKVCSVSLLNFDRKMQYVVVLRFAFYEMIT